MIELLTKRSWYDGLRSEDSLSFVALTFLYGSYLIGDIDIGDKNISHLNSKHNTRPLGSSIMSNAAQSFACSKFNSLTPERAENQNARKIPNSFSNFVKYLKSQMVPCHSAVEEISFEWSHHRNSLTDLKVRTALHCDVSIIDFGSGTVDYG